MDCFINIVDRITERISKILAWLMIALVMTLCFEVFMRYVLNSPTMWSFDLTYMTTSLFVSMGLSYTLQTKGHVSVDIVTNRLSKKSKAFLNIVFYLIFLPTWFLIAGYMTPNVIRSWQLNEVAISGTWLPPVYPFKTWILIAVILFTLQIIAELLKNVKTLTKGGQDHNEH